VPFETLNVLKGTFETSVAGAVADAARHVKNLRAGREATGPEV
jgi:hypothetical protein